MDEQWKPAPGFETRWEVSNLGRARTRDYLAASRRQGQPTQLRKGRILSPALSKGYPRIDLKEGGKTVARVRLHRLVALAFVEGHFAGATVDHIDGNRLNNCANNLRWVSRSENTRLQNVAGRGVPKGEKHPSAKLRDDDLKQLFALRKAGWSLSEVGRQLGVSWSLVHKIEKGLRRRHAQPPAENAA